MKYTLFTLSLCLVTIAAVAQTPFPTCDSLTINKVSAAVLVHGDMWYDPTNYNSDKCLFPRGTSGAVAGPGNAIWLSGYDGAGQLHVAAQTYRQNGNDFWPGPLIGTGAESYGTSHDWAKIWKVNRSDIETFKAQSGHTISNTPDAILTWPGKGNTYAKGNENAVLNVATDMAPFADLNGNGIYEPLQGEYPQIKGDQELWWVFNDNGPVHNQSNGTPMGVTIKASSYGYSRGTLMDNVVYYNFEIENFSDAIYTDCRLAFNGEMNLGYYMDDYVGFDSTYRQAISYKGTQDDGAIAGHPSSYPEHPVAGVTIVSQPSDGLGSYTPAGAFVVYENDASFLGRPAAPIEYDNYMRAKKRDGSHFKRSFVGPRVQSWGFNTGPDCNYVYDGDPGDTTTWSECACNEASGDIRFVLSTGDFSMPAGSIRTVLLALVLTDTARGNGCGPGFSFEKIRTVADTAWGGYNRGVTDVPAIATNSPAIFPNPANDKLNISFASTVPAELQLYNTVGQQIPVVWTVKNKTATAYINELPAGMYYIRYTDNGLTGGVPFLKQ